MQYANLWKQILNSRIIPMHPDETRLQEGIVTAPIIIGPPLMDGEKCRFDFSIFRGLSLPFEKPFWLERNVIANNKSSYSQLLEEEQPPPSVGSLVVPQRLSIEDAEKIKHPNTKWLLTITTIARGRGTDENGKSYVLPSILDKFVVGLTDTGDLLYSNEINKAVFVYLPIGNSYLPEKLRTDAVRTSVYSPLQVLFLLSCKNITLKANDNDPNQVRRAVKRFGNISDYKYYTLTVRPHGASSSSSSSEGQELGVMPRHLCRGHFSEYGPEFNKGLLFGKHAGRFYVPPHFKGLEKNGIIEKDYKIEIGKEELCEHN